MKLLSTLVWPCLRLWRISRHLAGEIRTSGPKAGLTFLTKGFKARLPRLLGLRRDKPRPPNDFDRKWGTDTSGRVRPWDLGVSLRQASGASSYTATSEKVFHDLIAKLDINFADYVFVDCGSGKGLVVLLASQYSFKRIVGVEFSPGLHKVAQANLSRIDHQTQRCLDIELICLDATQYDFPAEPCVVYFFNPFAGEDIMQNVVANIVRSLAACPRDLFIIYVNPAHLKCLERFGAFEQVREMRFSPRETDWAVMLRARKRHG